MTRLITALTLSTALATAGCAHTQLTKQQATDAALGAAVITALTLIAVVAQCANCDATTAMPPQGAH